jgi:thiamine biosynthesis lipoprotein
MGTTARVTVVGGSASLVEAALHRVDELETRWSRFRPTSELSRLNAADGAACIVSPDTYTLVDHLVAAWHRSAGRFDPTLHDPLVALGYAASWPFTDAPADLFAAPLVRGCGEVHLDQSSRMVWLPAGLHLDPGGLGKGLAADIVAIELIAAGAEGALVDLGGDLRVMGTSPTGGAWRIGVEHPADARLTIAVVETFDGGVATSSRGKRRWRTIDGADVHHMLDPRTAHPASPRWVSATALAASAVEAEVAATVAFLDGDLGAAPWALAALLADADGATLALGDATLLRRAQPAGTTRGRLR